MKKFRCALSFLLVFVMLLSTSVPAFASTITPSVAAENESGTAVVVTDSGVYINDVFYTQDQFIQLLETAQEIETTQPRSAAVGALVAGTWYIPGIGQVIVTAAGAVLVAGAVIEVGSWIYDTVVEWFATRAEIKEAKEKIPERLKDEDGEVDLDNFDQKVNGKTAYKEKGGWTIEKDTAGHGGRKWKLKDKSGNRVASLDENGKVLGK